LMQRHAGGVDAAVRHIHDGFQNPGFERDGAFEIHAVRAQGVAAPGFTETPQQGARTGVEKDDLALDAAAAQLFEDRRKTIEAAGEIAGVDTDRDPGGRCGVQVGLLQEFRQHTCRQIIDAGKAQVFQNVERGTFSGAGAPADHH